MTTGTDREFVSESIRPLVATADTGAMAAGGPGLPLEFRWRDRVLRIAAVVRTWRETGACKHGSGEAYVRKHWFEVETTTGRKAMIYFERQPRGRNKTARWWLYSIDKEKPETQDAVRAEFPSEHSNRDP